MTLDPAAAALIPTGAPRGLYDTHHLWMPRFSVAYTLNELTVIRGGVGVFYDKPEGNVIFSQVNLPPFVPSVSVENGNLANPLAGRAAAESVLGTVNAIDPHMDIPRQTNFCVSLQRELRARAFRGNRLRRQPRPQPALVPGDQPARRSTRWSPTRRCPARSAPTPTSCVRTRATRRSASGAATPSPTTTACSCT